jgi:phenylacetate-coenzyme A ligase PaaK-like adenylate-forming protein
LYEFVPEAEWAHWRDDQSYIPQTVLLDEVRVGERYEVVITNFYGGPFLRYRLHDLVKFISLRDGETGIELPAMLFVSRNADLIDLAGFTGLIDEKQVWQAIENTGVPYVEWAVRKEPLGKHTGLHLYIEPKEDLPAEEVAQRVHEKMKSLNPFYADLEAFIDMRPLRITLLSPGTFLRYMHERQAAGADLAHLKPPHMNASDTIIADLLRLSKVVA